MGGAAGMGLVLCGKQVASGTGYSPWLICHCGVPGARPACAYGADKVQVWWLAPKRLVVRARTQRLVALLVIVIDLIWCGFGRWVFLPRFLVVVST